ncbi:MAG: ADYC domain-containing protein [Archangium sp.]
MKSHLLSLAFLLAGAPALAAPPPPCQGQAHQRDTWPNGTLLWGTSRKVAADETSSVLASLELGHVQLGGAALKGVRIEGGRLVAPSLAPKGLVGAMLQGTASDGQPVEVAICSAESAPQDPGMAWYRIEVWNKESAAWENPCIATTRVPSPRALAVRGVWDGTGARHDVPGRFTFACESGAIAKCIDWGYKPWASKNGYSLEDLHQACTRMARADYCGDGRSHTREDNPIDMYDGLRISTRTTEATANWDPARAPFEAAWTPEGAWCLARTRDGRAAETVLSECPGRFEAGEKDLGEGDRCTVLRKGGSAGAALLRNHSYGKGEQILSQRVAQ